MQFAQGNSVLHSHFALRIGVRNDMRSIQEFDVSQATAGALFLIGVNHAHAETLLPQPGTNHAGNMRPPPDPFGIVESLLRELGLNLHVGVIIDGDGEREVGGIITDNVNRPCGCVFAWDFALKIDKRNSLLHGLPKADIVTMHWIRSPVFVLKEFVRAESILVGTGCCCGDGKRDFGEDSGLPDAGSPHQGYSLALEFEALFQKLSRKDLTVKLGLPGEPVKGGEANLMVGIHVS